jgi:hypothetical protein
MAMQERGWILRTQDAAGILVGEERFAVLQHMHLIGIVLQQAEQTSARDAAVVQDVIGLEAVKLR